MENKVKGATIEKIIYCECYGGCIDEWFKITNEMGCVNERVDFMKEIRVIVYSNLLKQGLYICFNSEDIEDADRWDFVYSLDDTEYNGLAYFMTWDEYKQPVIMKLKREPKDFIINVNTQFIIPAKTYDEATEIVNKKLDEVKAEKYRETSSGGVVND